MIHISAITATIKINAMLFSDRITKVELSERLGIGRPTLDNRLKNNKWKKGELEIIKNL